MIVIQNRAQGTYSHQFAPGFTAGADDFVPMTFSTHLFVFGMCQFALISAFAALAHRKIRFFTFRILKVVVEALTAEREKTTKPLRPDPVKRPWLLTGRSEPSPHRRILL